MSRAERLLDLIQALRRRRAPVSGQVLAAELGVSLRTVYRDIATLQAQGADIAGEAGVGYVLRPGFLLPPLMFSDVEIEALVLGMRWVIGHADEALVGAATEALAKIAAVLPGEMRERLDAAPMLIGPGGAQPEAMLPELRRAISLERRLEIDYSDGEGATTRRIVWPLAVAFFDHVRILVAWCELRADFRHFRLDRIAAIHVREERYRERRLSLLRRWRQRVGADREV